MGCPDVGCGRGAVTWELARRAGTTGRAVGIDIDRTVLELARHEAERDGAWAIEYHEADVLTAELAPEYDAIYAQQSTVTFSYVFGSEEYSNYANTGFNDVFGFFVNGTNCALVPGTTDPVSVNTINNGNDAGGDTTPHHPELFRDNVNPSPSI